MILHRAGAAMQVGFSLGVHLTLYIREASVAPATPFRRGQRKVAPARSRFGPGHCPITPLTPSPRQATPSAIPRVARKPTGAGPRTAGGIVDNVLGPIPCKRLVSQFFVGSSAPWTVSISIIAFEA